MYWVKIRRLREEKRWTQQDLADRVGVHRTTINRIEKRVMNPSLQLMEKIAKELGVSLMELFEEEKG